MTLSPCQQLSDTIGQLFDCTEINGAVRIRTPYLYPDGDVIDIFYKTQGDQQVLTDFGETLRWLEMQTQKQDLSKRQELVLQDIRLTHSIEMYKGMLMVRVGQDESLSEAITRLGQAIVRVSDLWFLARTRVIESILDEVVELLQENQIQFEQNVKLLGRSTRNWKVDFHTWNPKSSALIQVLSTGSRAAANRKVNDVVAAWTDLNQLKAGREPNQFISLFDDTLDVWGNENIRQLEEFSNITYWSRPEELVELLVAA
jgi:Domain of unknown function DUF1828